VLRLERVAKFNQFLRIEERQKSDIAVMQAITMNERRFDAHKKQSDWIQRRIFPGARLASIREILNSLGRSTGLSLYHVEDTGLH